RDSRRGLHDREGPSWGCLVKSRVGYTVRLVGLVGRLAMEKIRSGRGRARGGHQGHSRKSERERGAEHEQKTHGSSASDRPTEVGVPEGGPLQVTCLLRSMRGKKCAHETAHLTGGGLLQDIALYRIDADHARLSAGDRLNVQLP